MTRYCDHCGAEMADPTKGPIASPIRGLLFIGRTVYVVEGKPGFYVGKRLGGDETQERLECQVAPGIRGRPKLKTLWHCEELTNRLQRALGLTKEVQPKDA